MNLYLDDKQFKTIQNKLRELDEMPGTLEKLQAKEELLNLLFGPGSFMYKNEKKTDMEQWFYEEDEMYKKIRKKRQQCERKKIEKLRKAE